MTVDSAPADAPLGISDLLRRAADPVHPAVLDGPTRLTTAQLDARVTGAALALAAIGAEPGDRVILALPTGVDFVVAYLGALRAGLIAVPLNPAYTPTEVDRVATDAGATLRVTVGSVADLLVSAPADGADPRLDRSGEQVAALLYTSGTSGQPKGAMLTARAMLANLDQMAALDPPLVDASDVMLVPLPLTHIFGLNAGLGVALRVGATLVLVDQFNPGATLDLMAQAGVTAVLGVPGQFAAWLRQPNFERGFAAVRTGISGASTLPPSVWADYAERGVRLLDGYGLTEAAPVVSLEVRPGAGPGSVGRPLPGVEVQLRDAGGDEIDEDEGDPGRLYVRGPNLFSGYWPDGRDGPDADGWFGTGDIAQRDADGNLHLVGRTSDLVVVHGFNVYPAEVESVLARQPGVAQVAVVGVADERAGESIRAFVVPLPGALLDPEALLAAASRSLARFKLPKAIDVVSSLPITVTGKVMKWRLGKGDPDGSDAAD